MHLNPVRAHMVERPEDYEHSSYRTYLAMDDEELIARGLIWGMISFGQNEAPKKYKEYVEQAFLGEIENPFKDVYGGMILGTEQFIKESLCQIGIETLHHEDVSHRRELQTALGFEPLMRTLCVEFNAPREALFLCTKHQRDMAIYLLKRYTGLTNREIGRLFGGMTYSAVAKTHERFSEKLKKDRTLAREVQRIMKEMSNVKG